MPHSTQTVKSHESAQAFVPDLSRPLRKPTRARIFHGKASGPDAPARKPLFTLGNVVLLALMLGFGMYATGNLPQLDSFFAGLETYGRGHNDEVVNAILSLFPALLMGGTLLAVGMVLFVLMQKRRERASAKSSSADSSALAGRKPGPPSAAQVDAEIARKAAPSSRRQAATDTATTMAEVTARAELTAKAYLEAKGRATSKALVSARAEAEARATALVRAAAADRAATSILMRNPLRAGNPEDSLAIRSRSAQSLDRPPSPQAPLPSDARTPTLKSIRKF